MCPTSYGYVDQPAEDVDMTSGDAPAQASRSYHVGENGAPVWRAGQEVGNMMLDGISAS